MARPKGKPSQEGKPTVEDVRRTLNLDGPPRPDFPEPPNLNFFSGTLAGVLARPAGPHPLMMTREDREVAIRAAFDLAEVAEAEYLRRYGK